MEREKVIEVLEKLASYDDILTYLKRYPVTVQDALHEAVKLLKKKTRQKKGDK